jgi:hypothetical protein
MLATAVISALFFDFKPTLSFGCGFAIVCVSLYLYTAPSDHLVGIVNDKNGDASDDIPLLSEGDSAFGDSKAEQNDCTTQSSNPSQSRNIEIEIPIVKMPLG